MNAPVPHAPAPDHAEVFRGNQLAPGETCLWQGRPLFRRVAFDVFHARGIAAYFVGLLALDAYQAWAKRIPLPLAIHNSVPLVLVLGLAGGLLLAAAWLVTLTTRYEVTDRRVILRYGMALPATLSLPHSLIVQASVAINRDHTGDVALVLKNGNHMPYLKLWPLARAWRLSHPEPMLRGVPRAAVVGALIARALATRNAMLAAKGDTKETGTWEAGTGETAPAVPRRVAEPALLSA